MHRALVHNVLYEGGRNERQVNYGRTQGCMVSEKKVRIKAILKLEIFSSTPQLVGLCFLDKGGSEAYEEKESGHGGTVSVWG
jgi:hypothetical protein